MLMDKFGGGRADGETEKEKIIIELVGEKRQRMAWAVRQKLGRKKGKQSLQGNSEEGETKADKKMGEGLCAEGEMRWRWRLDDISPSLFINTV